MTYARPVNPRRLLLKLHRGQHANIRFADLARLVQACGFALERVRGSHHIFVHPAAGVILNLQNVRGEAKPYQVRQVMRTITEHGLTIGDSP